VTGAAPAADGGAPVRIVLRPLASALPLGFFAFGTGMAVLGGVDIPLLPQAVLHPAAVVLLTFVAPLQILAAVLAFLARDGMAATGLGLFAAAWATIGVQDLLATPGSTSPVLGLYLITFTVIIALLGTVAVRAQPLLGLILMISSLRTVLAGVYEVGGPKPLFTTAGVIGVALTALAFYGALAFLLEDTAHRTVLPLARRGQARTSLTGDVYAQLHDIETEAGVRRSL
jgi:succinate-acetate transporter protein